MRSLLCAAALVAAALPSASAGALWDFVHAPTNLFSWNATGQTIGGLDWTGHMLNMTSGSWLTPNDTNR